MPEVEDLINVAAHKLLPLRVNLSSKHVVYGVKGVVRSLELGKELVE